MATSSSIKGFTFGIEIEIYLKPKPPTVSGLLASQGWATGDPLAPKQRNKNRVAILNTVADILNRTGALSAVVQDEDLESLYREWQIKGDSSLSEDLQLELYGVEIVSPIMNATESLWSEQLDILFEVLADDFYLTVNPACSTHVHIQPAGGWTVTDVRSLFKATAVFDDAITKIMPASRKQTPWAKSSFRDITNFDSKNREEVSLKPEISKVEQNLFTFFKSKQTWKQLFDHFDKTIQKNENINLLADMRGVSMNFKSIISNCGTVEFRRPPGVTTAEEARRWAAFALGFVSASLDPKSGLNKQWSSMPGKDNATVRNLQEFVKNGLMRLAALTNKTSWKNEVDTSSFKEDKSEPFSLTTYSANVIHAKLLKAEKESSYEHKILRSRQNSSASNSSTGSPKSSPGRTRDSSTHRRPVTSMPTGHSSPTPSEGRSSPTPSRGPTATSTARTVSSATAGGGTNRPATTQMPIQVRKAQGPGSTPSTGSSSTPQVKTDPKSGKKFYVTADGKVHWFS